MSKNNKCGWTRLVPNIRGKFRKQATYHMRILCTSYMSQLKQMGTARRIKCEALEKGVDKYCEVYF